jgi:hypothetical protein
MASATGVTASDWLAAYPPPRSLTLDQEALAAYQHAYYIGERVESPQDPPISFTVLAAALLVGADDTSKWFAEQAKRIGPDREMVFAEKQITQAILSETAGNRWPPAGSPIRLSPDNQMLSGSSRAILESAENWAQGVSGSDIGVRHLVAAYVLNPPPYHRDQLRTWKVDEAQWRTAFFDWVGARFTWERWGEASQRAAPAQSRVAFEQPEVKGRSLAWPGDALARRVLEQAAYFHALRSDGWLEFLTLLFALVQTADNDADLKDEVLPIWTAATNARATYPAAFNRYITDVEPENRAPFADLDISPRVLNALETARELATASRLPHLAPGAAIEVSPLHLAGALLSRRVDADEEFAALGLDVPQLRKAMVDHAASRAETIEVWRELLGQEEILLTGRPVDLNSDEPEAVVRLDESWASDPLAIRPDVEAFAALLASRDLEPPLSIGLFGPWGSVKTTFIKRLKRAVERHAVEARTGGARRGPYVPNVVHVEFNAWHFVESALISSLVDTTIREIRAYVTQRKDTPQGWLDEKLGALESRRRQTEAAGNLHSAATAAVAAAQTRLADLELTAAQRASSFKAACMALWKATVAAVKEGDEVKRSGVVAAIGSEVQDLDGLRQRLDRLRARPGQMLTDLGWARSLFFAAVVLVVPLTAAMIVERVTGAFDFRAVLSSASAIVAVIAVWTKAASAAVTKVDGALAQVVAAYEKAIAEDEGVVATQKALKSAQGEAQTAAAALQVSRDDLARAQADVANASLPAQTLQLVSSRIEERSYTKELTTLSLARADLEKLSEILRAQSTTSGAATDSVTAADSAGNGLRTIDRVILYIDDLDRCRPEDVVRVLQLVHMLLAFELFVVVVAVDARWVEHALRHSYPWLSKGVPAARQAGANDLTPLLDAGPVTPEDYLEKIFQIAFWLEPMTAGRAASYLTSLVRPLTLARAATTPPPDDAAVAAVKKVDISSVELDYMRALAAYVGSSPRRVKRLVNAYRLIKARLSDTQLAAFVTHRAAANDKARSGPYQIVIGLLVIGTGASSRMILGVLGDWDPRAKYEDVTAQFRAKQDPEWTAAAQVIETIMRTQNATDVAELRGWARQVGRFLLHGPMAELGAPPPVEAAGRVEDSAGRNQLN